MRIDQPLGITVLVALLAIALSWFFLDTFTVTLGSLHHGVRFYDISAVIGDPTQMFFLIPTTFRTLLFGAFCLACLLSPLLVYWRNERLAALSLCAPLLLMLACGAMLYSRNSGEFFPSPSDASTVGGNLIRLANGLVHRGGSAVARHINVGVGGYLGFAGSLLLGLIGLLTYGRPSAGATAAN